MWQPNYLYGNDAYFPYSIGSLAAYAWSDSSIKKEYELSALFFLRESIDATIKFLEEPFLCAFSCYVWNFEYNKKLAKRKIPIMLYCIWRASYFSSKCNS